MAFTIPTYFTAVDKMSGPLQAMAAKMESFAAKAETGIARQERAFRKMTPAISEASKQMLSMVGTAALVTGAIGGAVFSGKSIMDYETSIANLSAITGTSGDALEKFKAQIKNVAMATKASSIDVANAFTMIGNNSPALLKDAIGLAEVTKQSIILAQAAKMELAPAADYLTQIMNQFNTPANQAAKVIDLLAGGMVIGSMNIDGVADAMTRFGGIASQVAGTSLQESVTAIEAISDKMKDSEKIGTQFRNMFLIMSNIKQQDPKALADMKKMGVNMDIVSSKSEPLINKLNELKKLSALPGGLEHVFGKENVQSIIPLLASTGKYVEMLDTLNKAVDKGGIAQKMADTNNATLARGIEILKNKFVTWITTSDEAAKAIDILKSVVGFLADHMSTILKVTGFVAGAFATWWGAIKIAKFWLWSLKLSSQAFFLVDMIKYVASTQGITMAQATWAVTTQSVTSAQLSLNAAMAANPISVVIAALAALALAIYAIYKHYQALEEIYNKAAKTEQISRINSETSAVQKQSEAYQKLGMSKAAADQQATANRVNVLDKTSSVLLHQLSEQYSSFKMRTALTGGLSSIYDYFSGDKGFGDIKTTEGALGGAMAAKAALLNPKSSAEERTRTINNNQNQRVTFDFKNMPKGVEVSGDGVGDLSVMPGTSSTMPHR
jgi:TP901 family phage tail tape measure protein